MAHLEWTSSPAVGGLITLKLPPAEHDGGAAFSAALVQRKTMREIKPTPIPMQLLANLLWAAFGVNRPTGPLGLNGRTAASASNSQEIDLYVALKEGTYLYDATDNLLRPKFAGDLRIAALTPGQQHSSADALAPIQLIYSVDVDRLTHSNGFQEPGLHDPDTQKSYYFVDTGLIAQNVYLFAAVNGLAAWFHNCDRDGLAQKLNLGAEQRVLFAQSVGYPKRA